MQGVAAGRVSVLPATLHAQDALIEYQKLHVFYVNNLEVSLPLTIFLTFSRVVMYHIDVLTVNI